LIKHDGNQKQIANKSFLARQNLLYNTSNARAAQSTTAMATLEERKKQIDEDWELIYNEESGILPALKAVLRLHMPRWGLHKIIDQLAAFTLPFAKVCEGSVPIHRQMSVEQIIHAIYINIKARLENGMIMNNKAGSVRKLRLSLFELLHATKRVYSETQRVPPSTLSGGVATPYMTSRQKSHDAADCRVQTHPTPKTPVGRSTFASANARAAAADAASAAGIAAQDTHVFPVSSYGVAQPQPSADFDRGDHDMSDLQTDLQFETQARAKYFSDMRNEERLHHTMLRQRENSRIVDGFFEYNPPTTTVYMEHLRHIREEKRIELQQKHAHDAAGRMQVWGMHEYCDWDGMDESLDHGAGYYQPQRRRR